MKTIYKTIGAAKEYCELAVDIYENCPHECEYCYAKAKVERKNRDFCFGGVRENVVEETRKYLEEHKDIHGKMIFLGFSSDPFPVGYDISATIEMMKVLKEFGCKIMLCTKSGLENEDIKTAIKLADSVGITLTCGDEMASIYEAKSASPSKRIELLKYANSVGCETWISFEPVLEPNYILKLLESSFMDYVTTVKLGKLNHMELKDLTKNDTDFIDWKKYGEKAIEICERRKINYLVKSALMKEMKS